MTHFLFHPLSLVLCTREMRNPFNLLLVALACFDSCYLTGSILESIRKCFTALSTSTHTLLFPWLLYPGQVIARGTPFPQTFITFIF